VQTAVRKARISIVAIVQNQLIILMYTNMKITTITELARAR
jgi:hypothetical protein